MTQFSKYQQLKIAGDVLGKSPTQMAKTWGWSLTAVRMACTGEMTSAPIMEKVDETIAEAEKKYEAHRRAKAASA